MDSNFQVRISANITDLQNSIKSAEATLSELQKATDGVSGSIRNMEQNANRGRMVAFAFGQVIRDAGFFSQSFGLGLLAVSNNIPILIDQLSLSVKALQPFAGALSIIGSLLTAGLTIWAYSAQATKKTTESIEDYINKLDDLRQSQINASATAKSEIIDLENLRKAAQNQALSVQERKKAIDEIKKRWPDYYKSLSDEAIMAGNDATAHRNLASAILSVAKAQANKDKIVLNSKKIDILYQKIQDSRLNQEKFVSDEIIKVRQGLIEKGIKVGSKEFNNAIAGAKMRIRLSETYKKFTQEQIDAEVRRGELLYSNLQLAEDTQKVIAKSGTVTITGDYGKQAKESKDIWKEFNNTLKAINLDPTTSDFEKLNKSLDAHRSMLSQLSEETYEGVSDDIEVLRGSMSSMKKELDGLEKTKEVNSVLDAFNLRIKDINGNVNATADTIKGQTVEAIDDLINKLQEIGGLDALVVKLTNLKNKLAGDFLGIQALIEARLEGLKQSFTSWKVSLDEQVASFLGSTVSDFLYGLGQMAVGAGMTGRDLGNNLLQGMAGFLKQLGQQMVEFGTIALLFGKLQLALMFGDPFTKIGAALALIGVGAALSLAAGAIAQSAGNALSNSGQSQSSPTPFGSSFGSIKGSTPFPASTSSMAINSALSNNATLETRVSGNDLVILMNRATNNRN